MESESHPHSGNQGPSSTSGSKEGLSVYGLFHFLAVTPQGKYLLKQYFLRPSLNADLIEERLDAISLFTRPANTDSLKSIRKSLRGVVNVRKLVINLRKGVSGGAGKATSVARSIWTGLRNVSCIRCLLGQRSLTNIIIVHLQFNQCKGVARGDVWRTRSCHIRKGSVNWAND